MQDSAETPYTLAADRRRRILAALERDGRVVAAELSRAFEVSEDTIRRDLREMASEGLLERVHGGALPVSTTAPSFAARAQASPEVKGALAEATAGLIQPGQVVIIDAGTTNVALARSLSRELRATIVTNSPPVAMALAEHPHIDVIMLGGRVRKDSLAAVDAATIAGVRQVRADLCFLGVCSVDPRFGITTNDLDESYVKQAMVQASGDVVALVTADKLGTASRYVIAPLHDLTWLFTESSVSEAALAQYRDAGVTVTSVPGKPGRAR